MTQDEIVTDFFEPIGTAADNVDQSTGNNAEDRVVDEIESLCMNCHEDVCILKTKGSVGC